MWQNPTSNQNIKEAKVLGLISENSESARKSENSEERGEGTLVGRRLIYLGKLK